MGLLDTILSTIDAKKRSAKRGIMDMLDNPQQWAGMQANRIQEDRYGGPENAQAMKQYLSKQPYDTKALTAANDALRNAAINESLSAVTAWHGSPHKFDKFDMSKIGTGEGAQAYGHGLYLAETPDVAQSYKNGLSNRNQTLWRDIENVLPDALKGKAADFSDAILSGKGFDDLVSTVKLPWQKAVLKQSQSKIDEIIKNQQSGGALYKVDIPDEAVARFLDWDKPLSEQAPEVQKALSSMPQVQNAAKSYLSGMGKGLSEEGLAKMKSLLGDPMEKISGSAAYKALTEGESSNAADILKNQGIPGIRYLDGSSRGTGSGTSNYVLFDDQLPRILERNGQPTGLQPWAKGEWKGLLDEPAPKLTEFEQRHLTAQKNAALPVEQGAGRWSTIEQQGEEVWPAVNRTIHDYAHETARKNAVDMLGLPENNTAMDRMIAQGYDVNFQHGSGDGGITAFDLAKTQKSDAGYLGQAVYGGPIGMKAYTDGGVVYPLVARSEGMQRITPKNWNVDSPYSEVADAFSKNWGNKEKAAQDYTKSKLEKGITGVIDESSGNGLEQIAIYDPSAVRSRFAAFDPKRRHEADLLGYADPYLLGAMGAGGLLGIGGYSMMNDK